MKVFYFFKALAQKDRAWGPSANREGGGLQLSKTAAATAVRDLNSLVPKPLAEAEEGEMKTTVQGEGRKENEVRNAYGQRAEEPAQDRAARGGQGQSTKPAHPAPKPASYNCVSGIRGRPAVMMETSYVCAAP